MSECLFTLLHSANTAVNTTFTETTAIIRRAFIERKLRQGCCSVTLW